MVQYEEIVTTMTDGLKPMLNYDIHSLSMSAGYSIDVPLKVTAPGRNGKRMSDFLIYVGK